ncbi:LacI family DNA-binding transcriptional regulator [Priestia taiwanensis]|uniref:LacI family transcriptional regulator n=1 Tax=Priestia taiwanensis TaxID=1347902 RepID=A0A917ES36_9BACI|nr:LacI family DNA-binding transcriptional regulator [Priestia taiwanensis]MBM7364558.1 DNA-binding LacI/PurR family transcriptional regulator [Priestia taiwanensis]GGE80562.1 LacI family transcriptional regulator [Priestia taiwanensis]
MAVTIKDVAKIANVAPSTVSRVIANSPSISEKTKKRIRKVMDELGYHPNFNARSLANQSTQAIGLVMPSSANKTFLNPFFPEVIRGISTFAHVKDYSLYMTTGETEEEIFRDVVKMVQGKRVDGIVVLYSRQDDSIIQYLLQNNFPFVLIGKPSNEMENITYIDNDNYKATREVTDYLLSLGHTRIAFVGGSKDLLVTKDRLAGFTDALKLNDLTIEEAYIKHMEFVQEGGKQAVEELLACETLPSAIVVTDDVMALGVLSALREENLKVPEDISVVSFNNSILSEIASPPLTTIDVHIYQLGYEAAKCVIDRIEVPDTAPKSVIVPTKLIVRQTC